MPSSHLKLAYFLALVRPKRLLSSHASFLVLKNKVAPFRQIHTFTARLARTQLRAPMPHPEENQPLRTVTYDGKEYEVVQEGLAEILNLRPEVVKEAESKPGAPKTEQQAVFYNPIQQFNRDLSVLAIRVLAEELEAVQILSERKAEARTKNGGKSQKGPKGQRDGKRKREEGDEGGEERPAKSAREEEAIKNEIIEDAKAGNQECTAGDKEEATAVSTDKVERSTNEDPKQTQTLYTAPNAEQQLDILAEGAPKEPRALRHPPIRILDALSATGLRAIRYSKEIPQATSTTAVDLSVAATNSIKLNVRHNGLSSQVFPITGNALAHMYHVASQPSPVLPDGSQGKYHVIDLDPYGTAAPFIDAAVQAARDGALLLVTCTDSAIFASCGYLEKTFSQYGGLPIKGPQSHEGGLRLLLHTIATSAARYGIAIEPLLSLSIDFYIRVFVRVRKSPSEVKFLAGKTMAVYNCDTGCGAWTTQTIGRTQPKKNKIGEMMYKFSLGQGPTAEPTCEHCGLKTHMAGPMWGGPLHNPYFVQRMLDHLPYLDPNVYGTIPRMEGMLSLARDETLLSSEDANTEISSGPAPDISRTNITTTLASLTAPIARLPPHVKDPHPFFLLPSSLAKVLRCISPSTAMLRSALLGLGYHTTRSHTKPGSLRTDAPWSVVWEVMREWIQQKAPVKEGVWREGTAGWGIMRGRGMEKRGLGDVRREMELLSGKEDLGEVRNGLERLLGRLREESEDGDGDKKGARLKVVFNEELGKRAEAKMVRYQINPRANWGPMAKAKGEA